mgnify:CR=1 FL=1
MGRGCDGCPEQGETGVRYVGVRRGTTAVRLPGLPNAVRRTAPLLPCLWQLRPPALEVGSGVGHHTRANHRTRTGRPSNAGAPDVDFSSAWRPEEPASGGTVSGSGPTACRMAYRIQGQSGGIGGLPSRRQSAASSVSFRAAIPKRQAQSRSPRVPTSGPHLVARRCIHQCPPPFAAVRLHHRFDTSGRPGLSRHLRLRHHVTGSLGA